MCAPFRTLTSSRWWFALALAGALACESPVGPGPTELPPLDDLPDDLAALRFTTEGTTSARYVMLEIRDVEGFRGFVAINGAGQPVWYFRTEGGPFSFTRRANGNLVLLDSDRGLFEVTRTGEIVAELAQAERPGRRIHHDVTTSPWNTILFIAEEWQPWNDGLLNGEAIWEWVPETGAVTKRWSAFDHLDPALDWGPRSVMDDWLHANSIHIGPRGNIVMSLHFLNQVISISPDFGSLEWRLGGMRATITVDDPFSGQHTAVELSPGRILMFDNGFERSEEAYSRAIEYEIGTATATVAWQWRPARDNWARVISSARRLPNGNTMVAFGVAAGQPPGSTGPIEVYEVSPAGDVVWHLTVDDAVDSMYRATPLMEL